MEQLISPKTLASMLGLAEQTIYNRHSTGGDLPPAIKLGRLLRFRQLDVEAWITQFVVPPKHTEVRTSRRGGRPTKLEQVRQRESIGTRVSPRVAP